MSIPKSELYFDTMRASGPGGQNVNKNETKVRARWDFFNSVILSPEEKKRIKEKLSNHINSNGELFIESDDTRGQNQNKLLSVAKLERIVREALKIEKKRIKTKPNKSSIEKRLKRKRINSEKKKGRKIYED